MPCLATVVAFGSPELVCGSLCLVVPHQKQTYFLSTVVTWFTSDVIPAPCNSCLGACCHSTLKFCAATSILWASSSARNSPIWISYLKLIGNKACCPGIRTKLSLNTGKHEYRLMFTKASGAYLVSEADRGTHGGRHWSYKGACTLEHTGAYMGFTHCNAALLKESVEHSTDCRQLRV